MDYERFNHLVNGPLTHPLIPLRISRLVLALAAVVEATGEAGECALEVHCAEREWRDNQQDVTDG